MGIKTCIKCGKGGNVLVCKSSECVVAIHESCCMPSSLQVHDRENFCCPYCLYKQSVAECCQAKDKALSAETNLALFLDAKMSVNQEHEPDITTGKWTALQNHKEHGNQERERKNKERVHFQQTETDPNNGEYSLVHVRGVLSDEQASSSTRDRKGGFLRKCKGRRNVARCIDGMTPVENQKNCDGQFCDNLHSTWDGGVLAVEPVSYNNERIAGVECPLKIPVPLAVVGGELAQFPQPMHNYAYENQNFAKNQQHPEPLDYSNMEEGMDLEPSGCNFGDRKKVGKLARKNKRRREAGPYETSICSISEGNIAGIYEKTDRMSETYISCNDRTEGYSRLGRQSIENAIELKNYSPGKVSGNKVHGCNDPNTVITGNAGWIDKPNKKILDGVFYSRRKRVRWTTEEEEMLKKGVCVFLSSVNKNLPWRKILEFGSHVFHQWRTPLDLQSKWKIMSRKEHLKSNEA